MPKKFDGAERMQSQPQPADERLPFKAPGVKCNARLNRRNGYCTNPAGEGTPHFGSGRCALHGGTSPKHDVPDGPLDMWRAAGLEQIINMAETMSGDDQEYLFHVSNNALTVIRAGIVARMHDPLASSKELADLSMALTRVDKILGEYPNTENDDDDLIPVDSNTAEFLRLNELEKL